MRSRRIKDWPRDDRPREKLLLRGPEFLTPAELLALVLGNGDRRASALGRAHALLERFPEFSCLADAGVRDLQSVPGIGPVKAAQIVAVLEIARRYGQRAMQTGDPFRASGDVYAHYREHLAAARQELFLAVLLDNKHRKIKDVLISRGSLTASAVHPRDVFTPIIREAAAAVVFVHNHPSGDPTPSREDLAITKRLRDVGDLVGVRVLDHIVIGQGRYVSFVDAGYW